MEELTLEQAALRHSQKDYNGSTAISTVRNISFQAGAEWEKEQYKELLHLYEQIATAYFFRHFNESQLLVGYTNSELLTKIKKLSEQLQD